jgi:hypothetical protein
VVNPAFVQAVVKADMFGLGSTEFIIASKFAGMKRCASHLEARAFALARNSGSL